MADAPSRLTEALAREFAAVALANVVREYPYAPGHVLTRPDSRTPREMHPAFYGAFDWHSAVHMHWLLVAILRRFPAIAEAPAIIRVLDEHLTARVIEREAAYFREPGRGNFERTYGWAWLLTLAAELHALAAADPSASRWREAIRPLETDIAARLARFLPASPYPIRAGTHSNSAFALVLALDYAAATGDRPLADACRERAASWFGRDSAYPVAYEPSADDFLSPGLLEIVLMSRVFDGAPLRAWLDRFLPAAGGATLRPWLEPAVVPDRTDGKLVHLDGLNLSRAWCWRLIAGRLADHPFGAHGAPAAERHLAVSLPNVNADYAGSHWLATFAGLAMMA